MKFTKLSIDDLQFLNEVRNIYAEEFLHDSRKFTIDETFLWFNLNSPDYWIIWKNVERIGYFRLNNYSEQNLNIHIGADIHPRFCGLGLGYKSYMEFIGYLFGKKSGYRLNKISLEVLSTNLIAIGLYKKIGFIQEGTKREEVLKNGIYIDSIIMSILRKEYEKMLDN